MVHTDNDKVNLLEWQLNDTNRFEEYKLFLSGAVESSNERTINNVRYSMALADSHNQINAGDQYMFIGGIGVLGNIVRHLGEYSAVNWRDSHDMDILCRNCLKIIILSICWCRNCKKSLSKCMSRWAKL